MEIAFGFPGDPAVCYCLHRSRAYPGNADLAHPPSSGDMGLICLNADARAGRERQKRVATEDSLASRAGGGAGIRRLWLRCSLTDLLQLEAVCAL